MEVHGDSLRARHCEEAKPTKQSTVSCHVEQSETSLTIKSRRFVVKIFTTPACRQAGRHRGHRGSRRLAAFPSLRGGEADEACLPAGRQSTVSCHVERSETSPFCGFVLRRIVFIFVTMKRIIV